MQELHHRRIKKKAVHMLYTVVKAASADLGIDTPFGSLTQGMIRPKNKFKPRLKLKAAELRRFVPVLKHMLKNHFSCTTPRQGARLNCLHHLDACYREMEDGAWNDDTSQAVVADHTRKFLMLYKQMQDGRLDMKCWNLYPKHHIMVHCVQKLVNPKAEWCYSDESEIGTAGTVAQSMHKVHLHTHMIPRHCKTNGFVEG